MIIEIKGLEYNEVTSYLDGLSLGEGNIDIYVDDYGLADADAGDNRRLVEIDVSRLDMDVEDAVIDAIEDLMESEPDAEVNYL